MFSQDSIDFLKDLKSNNDKEWFNAEKSRYVAHIKDAARSFCDDLAPRLAQTYGADVTSKIFRINRDLRFSKDKTPYNTHVHMSFHDAATGAAWMVGLQIDKLVLGFGLFGFDKAQMTRWRDAVSGPQGDALSEALANMTEAGLRLEEPELKRVPSPFDKDHPNGSLLRRKGIALWDDSAAQSEAFGLDAPVGLAKRMAVFDPLRSWMVHAL